MLVENSLISFLNGRSEENSIVDVATEKARRVGYFPIEIFSTKSTRSLMKCFDPHFSWDWDANFNQGKVQFNFDM